LQVDEMRARLLAADDVGVALKPGNGGQHLQGRGVQMDALLSGLAVGKPQLLTLEIHFVPFEGQNLA
jgi:hypothetical protein